MLAFKVDVFCKVVDVTINQLELRFEGQRQVAELFKCLFPDTMLKISDVGNRSPKPANGVLG